MKEITMIQTAVIYPHPENPRQQLGDLKELAESIKKNGVMQNLTVVPGHFVSKAEWVKNAMAEGVSREAAEGTYNPAEDWADYGYTVVIGHRRLAAAKMAGITVLPCVICEMDHREQIATMLEENMQRSDLTVYEQAQGFQLMMDLGYSAEEISEKTGFSRTTVDRRLKMAELDKKTFEKAVGKQITIEDLDKLGQLESVKQRNELLKEYGENNFDWKLMRAIKVQKAGKVRGKAHQMLQDAKVKQIPEKDRYNLYSGGYENLDKYTLELDKWDGKHNIIPKVDGDLFYMENDTDIRFYNKIKKKKAEPVKKTPEELEEEKQIALAWKTAERIETTAWEMREQFAAGLKVTPKNAMEMLQWALIAAVDMSFSYGTPTRTLREKIPIEGYETNKMLEQIHKWMKEMPQNQWPAVILQMFHGDGIPGTCIFTYGSKRDRPKYNVNRKMEHCYEWLTQFGYQMSDEEIRMMAGTHEIFQAEVKA